MYRKPIPPPSDGHRAALGTTVSDFHTALGDIADTLPTLQDKIERAIGLFHSVEETPTLTEHDRRVAAAAAPLIRDLLGQLDVAIALHSEPHDDNVIWTANGPVLVDFEACCTGPLEWDLAYLPREALQAFPHRDDTAIDRLRAVNSYCVAAWCAAQRGRSTEIDVAAHHHLTVLHNSWLAR